MKIHSIVIFALLILFTHLARAQSEAFSDEIILDGRYLNVPVKAGAERRTIDVEVDGQRVRSFDVELGGPEVDFWAFTDLKEWGGKRAIIRLRDEKKASTTEKSSVASTKPAANRPAWEISDVIRDADEIYREPLRPQFHFTTRRGWNNDPNGLFYYQGEYHLFYQYQPFSVRSFSDKSWGHAISRDLVHWEEQPAALHPDNEGAKWSGTGLVDWQNHSGLGNGKEPPLLLFYTATGRSAMNRDNAEPNEFVQSIAYSHDRGRTWKPYEGNPVLENITPRNRDPQVFWHKPTERWIMVLYVGYPRSDAGNRREAQIFSSTNLKTWKYESSIPGFNDCPILFELPLDGKAMDTRWIIHAANLQYKIGRFDGYQFTAESELLIGQRGDCAYAAQIFNDMPDERRVQIAWGRTKAPGMPFSQIMTFPCELALVSTTDGPRMKWQPVKEIERLHGKKSSWRARKLSANERTGLELTRNHLLDVQAVIDIGDAREIEINVRGIPIVCHVKDKLMTAHGYAAPLNLTDGKWRIRFLLDRTSLEIFAEDGLVYMPLAVIPQPENERVSIAVRGGDATAEHIECVEMNSIWAAKK